MKSSSTSVTIGALAAIADVNVETIRFYQRKGLMSAPHRQQGSIRRYGESDVARVRFIKAAQRMGFSLDDVAGLLKLDDGTHCVEARLLAERKLHEVRARLHDLRRMEAALSELVNKCCTVKGRVKCPLITSLQRS